MLKNVVAEIFVCC